MDEDDLLRRIWDVSPERGHREQNDGRHRRPMRRSSRSHSRERESRGRRDRDRRRSRSRSRERDFRQDKRRVGSDHRSPRPRRDAASQENNRSTGSHHQSEYRKDAPNSAEIQMKQYQKDLIAFVKKFPFLWKLKHPSHRDTNKKKKTWLYISAMLGFPVDECQKCWDFLRSKFVRQLRLKPECIVDDFKQLMDTDLKFLKPVYQDIQTSENSTSAADVWTDHERMQFLLKESLRASLQRFDVTPMPSASTENQSKRYNNSNQFQNLPSTSSSNYKHLPDGATSPSSARAFGASTSSSIVPRTLFDGSRDLDRSYRNVDSAAEENYTADIEGLTNKRNEILASLITDASKHDNSNLDQVLVDAVTANIKQFSKGKKHSIWRELLKALIYPIHYVLYANKFQGDMKVAT